MNNFLNLKKNTKTKSEFLGVCASIADSYKSNVDFIRILFVLLGFTTLGTAFIIYFALFLYIQIFNQETKNISEVKPEDKAFRKDVTEDAEEIKKEEKIVDE